MNDKRSRRRTLKYWGTRRVLSRCTLVCTEILENGRSTRTQHRRSIGIKTEELITLMHRVNNKPSGEKSVCSIPLRGDNFYLKRYIRFFFFFSARQFLKRTFKITVHTELQTNSFCPAIATGR
jgi:hypothetical protein